MGSKGDWFDNAVAESFFDLLRRRSFATRQEARTAVFDIEAFYNPIMPHSTRLPVAGRVREDERQGNRESGLIKSTEPGAVHV